MAYYTYIQVWIVFFPKGNSLNDLVVKSPHGDHVKKLISEPDSSWFQLSSVCCTVALA